MTHTIASGGTGHRVLVAGPVGAPRAVVLSLHGSTSTPDRQMLLSRMVPLADHGAVVAFPQGSLVSRRGWEWDLDNDVSYLDDVVDHLREGFDAAAAPLCVTGMSGGARMASRLSSQGRNPVRVLGAVAGLRQPVVERLQRPVRVLAFHGTRDRINPYNGGSTPRWCESVYEAAVAWARANGQRPEPKRTTITSSLTRLDYGSRDDPGAVTLWVCDRAGHTWPGTHIPLLFRLFLGRVSFEVDATNEIWKSVSSG